MSSLRQKVEDWKYSLRNGNPVTILEAHEDLSPYAFKAWIRLMLVLNPMEVRGYDQIGKILGYKWRFTFSILKELKRKGYIKLERDPHGVGQPIQLSILRRAKLVGKDHFIKFSSVLNEAIKFWEFPRPNFVTVWCCDRFFKHATRIIEIFEERYGTPHFRREVSEVQKSCQSGNLSTNKCSRCYLHTSCAGWLSIISYSADPKDTKNLYGKSQLSKLLTNGERKPRLDPIIGDSFATPPKLIPSGVLSDLKTKEKEGCENQDQVTETLKKRGLDPISFTLRWCRVKEERKELTLKERSSHLLHVVKKISSAEPGRVVDTDTAPEVLKTDGALIYKILSKDHPRDRSLFHPDDDQFRTFQRVLLQKRTSKSRQLVVTKLGEALVRVYTSYRRNFEPGFMCIPRDREIALEAAAHCFLRGVDPVQLISHWATEVSRFTKMTYPSLLFVCRYANIEEVSCCLPLSWEPGAKKKPTGTKKLPPTEKGVAIPVTRDSMNSFGKVENLDPRVRPGLTEAGIDVDQYDDKYLATFQENARIYTLYPRFFIPSDTANIVKWIARTIYGKKEI
jgi:hypothetical protein